jgi:hypothetical protein
MPMAREVPRVTTPSSTPSAAHAARIRFVVRSLLLPAVLELVGRWTWALPGWLERRLRRVPIVPRETADRRRPA